MFQYLYEWIQNIAFYMILVMMVIQVLPSTEYKKYIRFFTGLVLILMLAVPVLKLFGMDKSITDIYENETYQAEIKKIEESTSYLEDIETAEYLGISKEEDEEEKVEVEEIHIGR